VLIYKIRELLILIKKSELDIIYIVNLLPPKRMGEFRIRKVKKERLDENTN